MLSSDVVPLGPPRSFDGPSDGTGMMRHRSKKRVSGIGDRPTTMSLEFEPSMSPLIISSPSASLPSSGTEPDANGVTQRLPRRINIMQIIRPIPKRISTQFYNEVHREGLTLRETTQATMIANDWHRKWTYQDEENHTLPDKDFYQSAATDLYCNIGVANTNCNADSSFDFGIDDDHDHATNGIYLEREEGAKNPSLASDEETRKPKSPEMIHHATKRQYSALSYQKKQTANPLLTQDFHEKNSDCERRGSSSSTQGSTSPESSFSESDPRCNVLTKQYDNNHDKHDAANNGPCVSYHKIEDDEEARFDNVQIPVIQRPLPIRPVVVKPVAIHPNRGDFVHQQPTNGRVSPFVHSSSRIGNIPQCIVTTQFSGGEIVSPMSNSQLTRSSGLSSLSTGGKDLIGTMVLEFDQGRTHLVEDDPIEMTSEKDNELDSISTQAHNMVKARDDILHILAINDGDVESDEFKSKVEPLEKFFLEKDYDTRGVSRYQGSLHNSVTSTLGTTSIEGMWLTLSKPNFFGMLGNNDNGDPMYTLGRMSFDMFSPTNLVCSLQGNFNRIEVVDGEERKAMLNAVPTKLREEVEDGETILRTYQIVTAFTIEPSMASFPKAPNKDVNRPIRGIMTTFGYSLPDPDTPNRHSIWFTGGRIEPNNDANDIRAWKDFFELHPPKHTFGERAKLLAVKLLMGATTPDKIDPEDGSMNYEFTRPLGGHGMAYVDVIYLDESLRIGRGQRGTTFVFSRVPDV